MKKIESSGKTVDIAVENGLKALNISIDEAEVKVISEGGFLKSCKVLVCKKQTQCEKSVAFIEQVLEKMHFNFVVEGEETERDIRVNLIGTDGNSIIGYRGETLDALQYLTSLAVCKGAEGKRIIIDTENYRQKREETLIQLAKNLESKVCRTNRSVKLEPMNPYERRVIHATLQDSQLVKTFSEGVPPHRYVVVALKDQEKGQTKTATADKPTSNKPHNFVFRTKKKR